MPIDLDEFCRLHPVLLHLSLGTHEQLLSQGLLSASELLAASGNGDSAATLEKARVEARQIQHKTLGPVWLNDQSPLTASVLRRCTFPVGMTSENYINYLNQHVFFWPSEERLQRFVHAIRARHRSRVIVEVETRSFIQQYQHSMLFSPQNSGAPYGGNPTAREKFYSVDEFDFEYWAKKRRSRKKAIVEVVLSGQMSNTELLKFREA